jgi:hypothetical protein
MNSHPVHALDPAFQFLDDLIRDHGDVLYMGLVYAAIPLIAWILCGGLRRNYSRRVPPVSIIVIQQPAESKPPVIERERNPLSDDGEDSFAA